MLLKKYQEESITAIQKSIGLSRETIYKYIEKALALGPEEALRDKYHRPKEPTITENAKMWVVNIACTKPKDHGYAAELWTQSLLAKHTRKYAPKEGYACLSKTSKATIHRIITLLKSACKKIFLSHKSNSTQLTTNQCFVTYFALDLFLYSCYQLHL